MAGLQANGTPDPRRAYSRLRVGISAELVTIQGRQRVRLVDLSQGGAHLILSRPEPIREGVLTWLRFETFGAVVWQQEEHVGLEFDSPISPTCLVETRLRVPSVVRDEAMDGQFAARSWVNGSG